AAVTGSAPARELPRQPTKRGSPSGWTPSRSSRPAARAGAASPAGAATPERHEPAPGAAAGRAAPGGGSGQERQARRPALKRSAATATTADYHSPAGGSQSPAAHAASPTKANTASPSSPPRVRR